jgi:hypothetical protein
MRLLRKTKPSGYTPLWPETTVFIGAGATAALSMPTTAQQGAFFYDLAQAQNHSQRSAKLTAYGFLGASRDRICDLLDLLAVDGGREPCLTELTELQSKILRRIYRGTGIKFRRLEETVVSLRRYYSWDSLCRVIQSVPQCDNKADFLRDLFNLLDMHIHTNSGLPVCGSSSRSHKHTTQGRFIQNEGLRSARDCLVLFMNLLFACAYQKTRNSKTSYKKYVEAARAFSRMMQKEGFGLQKNFKLNERAFYLHSTAFISMNFDPLFISLFLSSNHEINSKRVLIGRKPERLKVALDLGHLWAVRPVTTKQSKQAGMWYPFNESVAQRLNDPEHRTGRRVRIAKFYFPHGNSNTRLCPNCGKTFLHLGQSWRFPDKNLFPPSVIPGLDWNYQPRSENEKQWREKRAHWDALQCFYCGWRTGARDNTMVMQTSFKGAYTPAIAETQNEIRALLEHTKHVVLLGYSLPKDDVIWRAFLAARRNGRELYCSVVVGFDKKFPDWLEGRDLDAYLAAGHEEGRETIISAREVFGEDKIRAYVGGIPSVFRAQASADESMQKILYPKACFPGRAWWKGRSA